MFLDTVKNIKAARRASLIVFYEGKNISSEIHNQLISCSQNDSINDLDTLDLTLENRDGVWLSSWMPSKGEEIRILLQLENWGEIERIVAHDMGTFFIDTVDFSGPPDIVNIKAISYDINSDIVDKKENHVWENVDFKTILSDIAKNREIEYICDISFNRKYLRIEQKLQSDFDFLKKLCEEVGYNFKLFNKKIVVFEEEKYEKKEVKKVFTKNQLESYRFYTEDTDTYSSCTIRYYDYKLKKNVERKFSIKNRSSYKKKNKRDLLINEDKHITGKNRVEKDKQLKEIAKKALRGKNRKECKSTITFMGEEKLLSPGDTIFLNDFGKFSGKYLIDDIKINLLDYKMTAEMHKIIPMEVES